MDIILLIFIAFFSETPTDTELIKNTNNQDSYETNSRPVGRITFKAKEGATLP
jgi:hypothetical protein